MLAGAVTACGSSRTFTVQGTEKSIGVDGTIEIRRQVEDINVVYVDLVNLPPPERHDQKKRAFVVWPALNMRGLALALERPIVLCTV